MPPNRDITLPHGNTLTQPVRVTCADGTPFYADDYAVIKIRDSLNRALWERVFCLGELCDEGDDGDAGVGEGDNANETVSGGAALVDWEITAAESARIKAGRYKWDMTVHFGAKLDARGRPVGAEYVVTPFALANFIVERVVSYGECGRNCGK